MLLGDACDARLVRSYDILDCVGVQDVVGARKTLFIMRDTLKGRLMSDENESVVLSVADALPMRDKIGVAILSGLAGVVTTVVVEKGYVFVLNAIRNRKAAHTEQ